VATKGRQDSIINTAIALAPATPNAKPGDLVRMAAQKLGIDLEKEFPEGEARTKAMRSMSGKVQYQLAIKRQPEEPKREETATPAVQPATTPAPAPIPAPTPQATPEVTTPESEHNQALGKLVEQAKGEIRAEFSKALDDKLSGLSADLLQKLKASMAPPVATNLPAPGQSPQQPPNGSSGQPPGPQLTLAPTAHMTIELKVPVSAQLVSLFEDWKAAANHRARMDGREEYTYNMEQFMVDCTEDYFQNNGVDYILNFGNPLRRFVSR